jgi:hypothetical protein
VSTKWVAGNVRAKALLSRRLGAGRTRAVAAMRSLAEAQHALAESPYGQGVVVGQALAETEQAVTATPLWHLRVLAGWQPREGAQAIRSLAAGFEAANIAAHARWLAGAAPEPMFALGALTTAWSRLRETSSLAELRGTLSQSLWGDPGGDSPSDIALGVQSAWAVRVATTVPEASAWASGALALLIARRRLLQQRQVPARLAARATRLLGAAAFAGHDLASFASALPARARWAFVGVNDIDELWRGEVGWWSRLEADGFRLLGQPGYSRARAIGAAAVLATDAWRCRAALQLAARGGEPMDVYDAVA